MRNLEKRGEAYCSGPLVGLAILAVWGGMIAALATGVAPAAAIAAAYIVLLLLLGIALPAYRRFISGLPLDGLYSWIVFAVLMSISAVVLAPLVGLGLIAAICCGKG